MVKEIYKLLYTVFFITKNEQKELDKERNNSILPLQVKNNQLKLSC